MRRATENATKGVNTPNARVAIEGHSKALKGAAASSCPPFKPIAKRRNSEIPAYTSFGMVSSLRTKRANAPRQKESVAGLRRFVAMATSL
jgi:hypothetical protein